MWHWSAGGLVMPRKSWLSSQLECAYYCSHTINSLNQELKWPVNVMLYLPRNVKWRAIASLNKQVKTSTNQTIFTAIIYYKALNQILGMKAAFNKLEQKIKHFRLKSVCNPFWDDSACCFICACWTKYHWTTATKCFFLLVRSNYAYMTMHTQ